METNLRRKAIRKVILHKLGEFVPHFLFLGSWIFCTVLFMRIDRWSGWIWNIVSVSFGFISAYFICGALVIIVCAGDSLMWKLAKLRNKWDLSLRDTPSAIYQRFTKKIMSIKEGLKKEVANAELEIKEEIAQTQPGDLSLPENTESEGALALDETQGTLSLAQKKNSA